MKDSNEKKTTDNLNDEKVEAAGSIVINAPKVAPKRIRVRTKTKPVPTVLAKTDPAPLTPVEISMPVTEVPKAAKQTIKKVKRPEEKIVLKKAPPKKKTNTEPMVQNVIIGDSKEEKDKLDSEKVIKKKAKKAEEKVDKLKKKIKKAKKKDVKKSKIKGLKEKLEKALEKVKDNVEKLKVE